MISSYSQIGTRLGPQLMATMAIGISYDSSVEITRSPVESQRIHSQQRVVTAWGQFRWDQETSQVPDLDTRSGEHTKHTQPPNPTKSAQTSKKNGKHCRENEREVQQRAHIKCPTNFNDINGILVWVNN